jgi:hypothetical protein
VKAVVTVLVLIFLFSICTRYFGVVQADIMWSQTYGERPGYEYGYSLVETSDGGYALTGATTSSSAGEKDVWFVKTDSAGNMQWNQTYGGPDDDCAYSLVETSDGGFALTGYTASFDAGNKDVWIVKTDASGVVQWDQTYGGSENDEGWSVVETSNGGFAIAGYTRSFGAGWSDFWLIRTDASGNLLWDQTYGDTYEDCGCSIVETTDGGYAVIGYTTLFGAEGSDIWLVKTDSAGNMQWNQTYGGTDSEDGCSMVETSDGGYAIVAHRRYANAEHPSDWDRILLMKTDGSGVVQWSQTYLGLVHEYGRSLVETSDGGYAIVGYTYHSYAGGADVWFVKTDSAGNMQWNQTYGGEYNDYGYSVVETSDGGYVLAGYTSMDVTSSTVVDTYFVLVKTQPSLSPSPTTQPSPSPSPLPSPTAQPSSTSSSTVTPQPTPSPTLNIPLEYGAAAIVIVAIAAIGVFLWKRR